MPAARSIVPTETTIREHAYHLWERDGRPHGRDLEYWDRAVSELAALTNRTKVAAPRKPAAAKAVPAPKTTEPKKTSTRATIAPKKTAKTA